MAKVNVTFLLAVVRDSNDATEVSTTPCYEGTVNGVSTGRSRVYSKEERPAEYFDRTQFTISLDLPPDAGPDYKINVTLTAWDMGLMVNGLIGQAQMYITPFIEKDYSCTANTGRFEAFFHIAMEAPAGSAAPGVISACRQNNGSTTCTTLAAGAVEIGILIRGCWGESHACAIAGSHTDMTLPTEAGNHRTLIGFFGNNTQFVETTILGKADPDFNVLVGAVWKGSDDYNNNGCPFYVDAAQAFALPINNFRRVSLFCTLVVAPGQAKLICDKWAEYRSSPPPYYFQGRNCACRAADTLRAGGVMYGIENLETPYNLFKTLKKRYGDSLKCTAGYAGFGTDGIYGIQRSISSSDPGGGVPPDISTPFHLDSIQ
jgi:hypothetical protein